LNITARLEQISDLISNMNIFAKGLLNIAGRSLGSLDGKKINFSKY